MAEEKPIVRIAPHSKEAEMLVLGCMLSSVNSLNIAADLLADTDFYFSEHKLLFHALQTIYRQEKPADIHIVAEELKRRNQLDAVGGVAYLTTVAQYAGTSAHIEEYADVVRNKSILRQMIQASQMVEKKALEAKEEVSTLLDEAQQSFYAISQNHNANAGVPIVDILTGVKSENQTPFLKELQARQERYREKGPNELGITGIPTHFYDLDKMVNGFNRSNLMILAGRPGMGKTALALNIAENICLKNGLPVGIFSLEMSGEQLAHRMICSQSGVGSDKILTGSLNGKEYQQVVAAVHELQEHTIVIDDQPGLKITDLRARARRMKEIYDIGFLVIDYLQLLSGSGSMRSQENRQIEISEISRMLKNLARELNIPILCGSQLSRKVEERQGHRPMLSDLRESGSIEQDSDLIFFLLRREYYDPHDKPGQAELIVAKNRHGATGNISLAFRKEIGQFANFSPLRPETSPDYAYAETL